MTTIVDPNNAMSFSAFGDKDQFQGEGARSILYGDRHVEIARRAAFYDCKQHDKKFWDFDGRPINPRTLQPLLGLERAWWVPLKMRRPSAPIRLGKVIVDSFTNLLFGENRFPNIRVEGDDKTEDWHQTISRVGRLPLKMIQARSFGGARGTVGMSWCFHAGKPRFEVHKSENLFVHRWLDRLSLIPEWVSEVYLFYKVKWDGKGFNKAWYWFRRDWTPEGDYLFKDVLYDPANDPEWEVDWDKSNEHGDGVCHLEWIQNLPSDEIDGLPDYDGCYENFDSLDTIMSVITRGATLNLDPTLKIKMDPDYVDRQGIKKGSDNALLVGESGDAEYLELGGSSITSGLELVKEKRRYILETAQCIVPDPHEVAAQGVSSVAIKAMFAPMTSKADVIREQYGAAMERMLANMEKVARAKTQEPVIGIEMVTEMVIDPISGLEVAVEVERQTPILFTIVLPPKMVEVPLPDPITGQETGETKSTPVPRELGPGGEITLVWPPYFAPTPQDQQLIVGALQVATGGKQFLSSETATEQCARAFGQEPSEEWRRVQAEGQQAQAQQSQMFDAGAAGGQVDDDKKLPPGAAPKPAPPPSAGAPADSASTVVGPHPHADPDAHVPVDQDRTRG